MEEFIRGICRQCDFSQQKLDEYWRTIHKDLVIFDDKRRRLLREVYEKPTEFQFVKSEKESHKNDENDEKYQIHVNKEYELMRWFSERFTEIQQDFRDYL